MESDHCLNSYLDMLSCSAFFYLHESTCESVAFLPLLESSLQTFWGDLVNYSVKSYLPKHFQMLHIVQAVQSFAVLSFSH